jgi:hypothetical protein
VTEKKIVVGIIGVSIDVSAINLPQSIKTILALPFANTFISEWDKIRKLQVSM